MVPRILQESFSTSTWRTQPATRLTVRCPEYEFALPEAIASRDISWDSQRGRGTCGRFGTPSRGTWTLILTVNQTSPYLKPILVDDSRGVARKSHSLSLNMDSSQFNKPEVYLVVF